MDVLGSLYRRNKKSEMFSTNQLINCQTTQQKPASSSNENILTE